MNNNQHEIVSKTDSSKSRILVVTGTRAEYGLFYPLLKRLKSDDAFDLQIVATGMHLSPEFGLTYKEIEADGFTISEKVEMLLSSDTEIGISKSVGIAIGSFSEVFMRSRPDLLLVLGDRFETFAATVSAHLTGIPVAHLHGGELTEGVIDDAFRHSITKMSYLHFTSTEKYRDRVIQLGESPERVFNTGALGIDNIKDTKLLSKKELENELGLELNGKTALVTFHPVTLESDSTTGQFNSLLESLDEFSEMKIIITMPNADTYGRSIVDLIEKYTGNNPGRVFSFASLGRLRYLSAMKYVDLVIGNSSSGIIETPSLHKPTVNIGDRQKGRIMAGSIIKCKPARESITSAIKRALSDDFQDLCRKIDNPYGDGCTADRIVTILKKELLKEISLKKKFHDIDNPPMDATSDRQTTRTGEIDGFKKHLCC